jgi:hypothetical protein
MTVLITVSSPVLRMNTCRLVEFQATGQHSTPLVTIVAPLLEECLSPAVGIAVVRVLYFQLTRASSSRSWKRMLYSCGLLLLGML